MAFRSDQTPKQISLGPLEAEILEIIWDRGGATAGEVHEVLLADPDRELAYSSVMTVLGRLKTKGWLSRHKQDRAFSWRPCLSRAEAQALRSHDQLQRFLSISNPDIVAAFADRLDQTSLEQLDAITNRLRKLRQDRKKES